MLGLVFVLLVCFLRRGLIGGIRDLYEMTTRKRAAGLNPKKPPRPRA